MWAHMMRLGFKFPNDWHVTLHFFGGGHHFGERSLPDHDRKILSDLKGIRGNRLKVEIGHIIYVPDSYLAVTVNLNSKDYPSSISRSADIFHITLMSKDGNPPKHMNAIIDQIRATE